MEKFFKLYLEWMPNLVLMVANNYSQIHTRCCRCCQTSV